jgi:hypothetical protein
MSVLDTTVLVYAKGADPPTRRLRKPMALSMSFLTQAAPPIY